MSKWKYLIWVIIVTGMPALFVGCNSKKNIDSSPVRPSESEASKVIQESPEKVTPPYEILKSWRPNNEPTGYGAEILLNMDYTEAEIISFVKQLATGHDPVVIRIFTSRNAYEQEQTGNYGPAYKSDYILFYVKNTTGRGAYRGFNEIRWMQEVGKYSSKFGLKTRM